MTGTTYIPGKKNRGTGSGSRAWSQRLSLSARNYGTYSKGFDQLNGCRRRYAMPCHAMPCLAAQPSPDARCLIEYHTRTTTLRSRPIMPPPPPLPPSDFLSLSLSPSRSPALSRFSLVVSVHSHRDLLLFQVSQYGELHWAALSIFYSHLHFLRASKRASRRHERRELENDLQHSTLVNTAHPHNKKIK